MREPIIIMDDKAWGQLHQAFAILGEAFVQSAAAAFGQMAQQLQEQPLEAFVQSAAAAFGQMAQQLQEQPLEPNRTARGGCSCRHGRASLWSILERPEEALAIQQELRAGTFDGMDPENCLIGTIARCRDMTYEQLERQLGRTPAEKWVMRNVHSGDTPANSEHAWLLDQWLTEWLVEHRLDLPNAYEAILGPHAAVWM